MSSRCGTGIASSDWIAPPEACAIRDHAKSRRNNGERNLLQESPPKALLRQPFKRPEIEQQQQARQRDERLLGQQTAKKQAKRGRPPNESLPASEPHISVESQEAEENAQHIFAFRDKGYRLDMNRMDGKQGRHQGTPQWVAGHRDKQAEQQQHIEDVQDNIGEVKAARIRAVQAGVRHQRKPGQRKPIAVEERGPSPAHAAGVQSAQHMSVL